MCVECMSGALRGSCKSAGILNHRCSLLSPFFPPRVDSAESKCNVVLQGKSPSDEHLLKLCTDVLRSKYLFEFMSFHVEPERYSLKLLVVTHTMLQTTVS